MADITMCQNNRCPSKDFCYRATATPNQWRQSYAHFSFLRETGKCEEFINNGVKPTKLPKD